MMRFTGIVAAVIALHLVLAGVAGAQSSGQARAETAGRVLIGSAAPQLTLKTIDGKVVDLGSLYGKQAVYLKFWATWCVPCRQQMPHFEQLYEHAGSDLAVIAINTGFNDSEQSVREFQHKLGITMPIVIDDGRLAAAFNLRVTPQHIVIGRDGRVLYVGHLDDDKLQAALAAARLTKSGGNVTASTPAPVQLLAMNQDVSLRPALINGHAFPLRDPQHHRPTVIFFLSPWCESYLATTRPEVSANCKAMREAITALQHGDAVRWIGIASGLWATSDDLKEYQMKYSMQIPLSLDESGSLFRSFGISEVPAAVLVDGSGRLSGHLTLADLKSADSLQARISAP